MYLEYLQEFPIKPPDLEFLTRIKKTHLQEFPKSHLPIFWHLEKISKPNLRWKDVGKNKEYERVHNTNVQEKKYI
jgi:hypothetical protein